MSAKAYKFVCLQSFIHKLYHERDFKEHRMTDKNKAEVMGHSHPTCSTNWVLPSGWKKLGSASRSKLNRPPGALMDSIGHRSYHLTQVLIYDKTQYKHPFTIKTQNTTTHWELHFRSCVSSSSLKFVTAQTVIMQTTQCIYNSSKTPDKSPVLIGQVGITQLA